MGRWDLLRGIIKTQSYWLLLSVLSGLLAGGASTLFLVLLELATKTRDGHPRIIWCLPLAGFFIGWVYHRFGKAAGRGNHLVIDEIHSPSKILPLRMAPLVLFGTVITHLFGGSAGREGTAVQMGATLSDQLSKFFHVKNEERKILLVAGAGAGFGAAIGAPLAGVIFGMEVIRVGRLKFFAPIQCLIASFVAYYFSLFLQAPHSIYPSIPAFPFHWTTLFFVVIAGGCFGTCARIFIYVTHTIERMQKKLFDYPPLRPLAAGLILSFLFAFSGLYRFAGLGISTIQTALVEPSPFAFPVWKLFLTALTVGSGFKGGEFIPMVFMGSTLGSALGAVLPVSSSLIAALGFGAVFGAGAKTPIACAVMTMEIFGFQIGIYASVACLAASWVSGNRGLYREHFLTKIKPPKAK